MTRINVGVRAEELPDKLLLAEHREITRIPNTVKSGRAKVVDIPSDFTLGKGHVKFFYNKLAYLHDRYYELYQECLNRSFNVTDKSSAFNDLPLEYLLNYNEQPKDRQIIIDRIRSRGFELKK